MRLQEIKNEDKYSLIKATYIIIIDKTKISDSIAEISSLYSIPPHLKRIKKESDSIKCLLSINKEEISVREIKINGKDYKIKDTRVPSRAPRNRKEFDEMKQSWTVNFFPTENKLIPFKEHILEFLIQISEKKPSENFEQCSKSVLIFDPEKNVIVDSKIYDAPSYLVCFLDHPIFQKLESVNSSQYDYLCTGLDAYITNIPCSGCCMALLHSRICNVYLYNTTGRIVEGFDTYGINSKIEFNHRFRVFKISE